MNPASIHPWLLRWLQGDGRIIEDPLPQPDDWTQIVENAKPHGLIPLLHRAFAHAQPPRIPKAIASSITQCATETAAKNLALTAQLGEILRAARARQIPCVPMRGIALGEQLYSDSTLRPTGDIDLLVRKEQLSAIRTLLKDVGCYEVEARRGFAGEFEYTLEFFKDTPIPLVVEPHWTIAYPPFHARLDMRGVWARCTEVRIAGIPTLALGTEDLLIHLCLHLLHHQKNAPVLWMYELDRLIRSCPLNWSTVGEVANQAGVDSLIHAVLRDVIRLFRTPIPDDAMEQFAASASSPQAQRITALLTQESHLRGRERIAMLLNIKGLRAKVRYAASFLFPSTEFIRVQYGVSSWWQIGWTYVRRACGLLWDSVRGFRALYFKRGHARSIESSWPRSSSADEWSTQNSSAPAAKAQA